ncbi:hypothetical protein GCM10027418_05220 [Mariniluteicoccus endophyticus]
MIHVVLGLLMVRPMSQYDLLKAFEQTISLFYSASPGSIRRALDQLAADGAIEPHDAEGGRGRRPWRITDVGRARFHAWMSADVGDAGDREVLARLFFLGHLAAGERAMVAARVVTGLERDLARLEALAREADAREVPAEQQAVFRYQRATLELGLRQAREAVAYVSGLAEQDG